MGVFDGQPVSAAITNPAFIDANADDTGFGKYSLQNADTAVSGTNIDNLQKELNSIESKIGAVVNESKTAKISFSNNQGFTATTDLKTRSEEISIKFNNSTGHTHSGNPGDAPQVASQFVANVKLRGQAVQGTDISSVSGASTNVSSLMTLKSASSSDTVKGVVTNNPYNKVIIRDTSNTEIVDSAGNIVYGRITISVGVWTLSYYVDIAGTETVYSIPSPITVRWYYQELFNPIVDAPAYSDVFFTPSDNTTLDVVDATESQSGKVLLSNITPPDIADTAVKGTNARVAHADHTHKGVHSVGIYGDATKLYGDIDLEAGLNIFLTRTAQRIKIETKGAVGYQEVPAGPVNGVNTSFGPLTLLPSSIQSVIVFVDGLPVNKSSWTLVGQTIIFSSNIPVSGQDVYVWYVTSGVVALPPTLTGTAHTEFRTITLAEATAKSLTLANSPGIPGQVLVDLIGGSAQEFSVDYTIIGSSFNWSGYALDGVLAAGDKIRFFYIT